MNKTLFVAFLMLLCCSTMAQTAAVTVNENEFSVDKKVVAVVKNVKQGFLKGRQMRLLNGAEDILVTADLKSYLLPGTTASFLNYCHIYIPQLKDSIQMYITEVAGEVNKKQGGFGGLNLDEKDWAAYFFKKNLVNADGSLNLEAAKALKAQHPLNILEVHNKEVADLHKCDKSIQTPTTRNVFVAAKVTETGRETAGNVVTIKYQVEHEGKVIGTVVGKGTPTIVANERAEIEFKPRLFGKQTELPMTFEIFNTEGCSVAHYNPQDKKLYTVRADKGGWHGIMSPILDKKVDSVKTRLEVVSAMVDYLIQLTYY